MGIRRATYAMVAIGMVTLFGWGSVAFACSPQPQVYSLLPESAAPGETVVVRGQSITSRAPVEIRWNGVTGDVLATAAPGPDASLSVPVRIPDVSPGVYSLMLVTVDGGVARTAFEVTAAAGSAHASPVSVQTALWPTVDGAPAASSEGAAPLTIGLTMLATGLVGLFAGSALLVARRRRVVAGPDQ